jgi:D-amino peptidase
VRARQMIEEGAKQALKKLNATKPYVPAKPTTITIELSSVEKAADFIGLHGVELVEPLKAVSRGKDWMEAWDQIWRW